MQLIRTSICVHTGKKQDREALEKGTTIVRDSFFRQYTKGQVVNAKQIIGLRKTTKFKSPKFWMGGYTSRPNFAAEAAPLPETSTIFTYVYTLNDILFASQMLFLP